MVVNCQESQLAKNFSDFLHVPIVEVQIKKFADTELYIDMNNPERLEGFDILLTFQFFLFNKKDLHRRCLHDQIAELIILTDFLKKIKVKSISVVIPYLPYSRQELSFDGKVVGPISMLGRIFRIAGIDRIFSCDLHSHEVFSLFGPGLFEIGLSSFWIEYLKIRFENEITNKILCIVSPDSGGYERARKVAESLEVHVACVGKKRFGPDETVELSFDGNVKGKVVVIFDDIVDTARTAVNACRLLKREGALSVFGVFTHPVFAPGAASHLIDSDFDQIYVSNTIPVSLNLKNGKISVRSINKFLIEKVMEYLK